MKSQNSCNKYLPLCSSKVTHYPKYVKQNLARRSKHNHYLNWNLPRFSK
ncbi:hypothetical protein BVRB_6g135870 [Beta vulgaris subsp. vulgaris]|nr:hypothetical protein BVRB_6g135870 [Beta vulgaris subsp. vulgaris]